MEFSDHFDIHMVHTFTGLTVCDDGCSGSKHYIHVRALFSEARPNLANKEQKNEFFVVDSLLDSQNCQILDKRLDGTNIASIYLAEHMGMTEEGKTINIKIGKIPDFMLRTTQHFKSLLSKRKPYYF